MRSCFFIFVGFWNVFTLLQGEKFGVFISIKVGLSRMREYTLEHSTQHSCPQQRKK